MKYHKRLHWLFLFVLLALPALSARAAAFPAEDAPAEERAIIFYEEDASPEELEAAIARVEGVRIVWRYEAFFSGAAVDAAPQALARLRTLPGVAEVRPARAYEAPLTAAGESGASLSGDGLALTGADALWEQGFTGDGTVIAVLDTGLLVTHEAFADASLMSSPAITREDVEAFAGRGRTAGSYVSARVPFAYDYYNRDGDVATTNGHGTHVAALAAGYALEEDGSVRFRGGAPGAQILSMKIFPDGASGGTDDSIILRALEDAWNLGADVVNISVGVGAGFVQDRILDGVYCRAFAQMAESGVIICCAAGNGNTASAEKPWYPQLPTAAYTDYGSVCSPASYAGAVAIGAASAGEEGAVPADYSSWGPASGLHLAPALLAFGGPVASAGVSGNSQYRVDYGTSMASPIAAGAFASLLQALRERGVTDRVQAARLAQGLLESTACVLRDAAGVPVSPRKQGAGLADLSAAVSSGLTVLDPLMELGESGEGKFTLTLTLRNLTGRAVTASLDVIALTDAYEKQGDACYSTLTARDITGDVTITGRRSVTVPANGEAEAVLTLTVSAALRQELAEVFTNGFYVEGFVTASGGGQPVHAAFLGYCGDWEAAPVLEPLDFRDVQDAWFRMAERAASGGKDAAQANPYLSELRADLGANLAFISGDLSGLTGKERLLGANGHAHALHDDARFAIPSRDTNAVVTAGGQLCLDLYALRNAAGIAMLVSDRETGALYYAAGKTWAERSIAGRSGGTVLPAASFSWAGTDASGVPLPGGTQVRVDVCAWLDTDQDAVSAYDRNVRLGALEEYRWLLEEEYAEYCELSFLLTLDGQAPTLSAVPTEDGEGLALTLRDDQYLAYAAVRDQRQALLAEEAFFPKTAGESGTVSISFAGGEWPDELYIQAEDYAGNMAGYQLNAKALLAGEQASPEPCAMLLLRDADLSAWYHDAVDRVLGEGIMEADGAGNFRPEAGATRAEIVQALYRANGSPAAAAEASGLPFTDIPRQASYTGAVCWAYENGLVAGETETAFAGSAGISRQQLAVMLWRWAKWNGTLGNAGGGLAAFPDGDRTADWAAEAMAWAAGQGIIQGEDGKLNPEGPVTRAQAAQMLVRFLER